LEEFKDENVGLILKTSKARNSIVDKMLVEREIKDILDKFADPDRKCKIYLLHGYMNNNELHSLYVHPKIKAIVNFGHGEGFGLPLFEAAYCEMPVITHDFGGQKDFLFAPKKGKKSAEKMRPFFSNVVYETRPVDPTAVWEGVIPADSEWAYVNEQAAKMAMRETYENYSLHKGKAKKLKKWILENFNSDEQHKKFLECAGVHHEIDEEIETLFNELEL
jgi:glycosyltransferase involved in cell wall biosynthesis